MLWYRLFGGMLPVRSRISSKPNLLNDVSADVSREMLLVGGDGIGAGGKVSLFWLLF